MQDFFKSRVVLYPGAGFDGEPVHYFGSRHLAHCFIYVDYGLTKDQIITELNDPRYKFNGYRIHSRRDLKQMEISPVAWKNHLTKEEISSIDYSFIRSPAYTFIVILERDEKLDEKHGPKMLAILFISADGIATYDALFCQEDSQTLFAVVLKDHGWGCNYTKFGRGGFMELVSIRTKKYPKFLWAPTGSEFWSDHYALDDANDNQSLYSYVESKV